MERLLSVLDGETKRSVESISISGIFYATALKAVKRDFGNPIVMAHLKMKHLFKQPQIQNNDHAERISSASKGNKYLANLHWV